MKQHITPAQALEITEDQFYSLFDEIVKRKDWANFHHKKVTIGKCIELLDFSLIKIEYDGFINNYYVQTNKGTNGKPELIDALFQAVKSIL